ncbi:MAG: KpsF/GutQ family sugar-phosphate isomerase [Puniceicoccales bacterium]|jgi:arabinose-5-phosphate isomerase|nr:KpsF/GutQ family sugar-phosphate isomerase [Puniceicoccales bacterium]
MSKTKPTALEVGRKLLKEEADALARLSSQLDGNFERVVGEILARTTGSEGSGKVILTGIGKSGRIAEKIAATLCSTGTQAVFLHSTEAVHGDMGIVRDRDIVIFVSKSGKTEEVLYLFHKLKAVGCYTVAIAARARHPDCELARKVDAALDIGEAEEAGPLRLAPTTSALLTLALGDALAAAVMSKRGFTEDDFSRFHPSGTLYNASVVVGKVMHPVGKVACVGASATLRELVDSIPAHSLGAVCVVDAGKNLIGIVTDGDLRRALKDDRKLSEIAVADVMTRTPVCTTPEATLENALTLMEKRRTQISILPVVEAGTRRLLGLLRLHDIYKTRKN